MNWEKEFDIKFKARQTGGTGLYDSLAEPMNKYAEEIKSFIHTLLEEKVAEIEKMKITEGNPKDGYIIKEKSTLPFNNGLTAAQEVLRK